MTNATSNDTRLQFLWDASHVLLPTVPALSAYYMQQFHKNAAEKDLILADGIKRTYCSYCGSIFIPGINSQTRIINVNDKKNKKNKKNRKDRDDDNNDYSDKRRKRRCKGKKLENPDDKGNDEGKEREGLIKLPASFEISNIIIIMNDFFLFLLKSRFKALT